MDTVLPVIVRRRIWQQHRSRQVPPPPTQGAQLACWATSRAGARQGWLTARHAAAQGLGTLVDAATECTDAALVSVGPAPWISQPATAPLTAVSPRASVRDSSQPGRSNRDCAGRV